MTRYPQGRAAVLNFEALDADGDAFALDEPPTVTIVDDSNNEVVTSETLTLVEDSNTYTFTLPSGIREDLGVYSAAFSYATDGDSVTVSEDFEIVGNHLFEIADLRAFDSEIADAERYPSARIAAARDAVTERLENAAKVAFASRVTRQTLSGDGTTTLLLPHSDVTDVLEVWVDGVSIDEESIGVRFEGVLVNTNGWTAGTNNIEVRYCHGYAQTPEPVKRAALMLALEYVVTSALPARATSQSTDVGDFRIQIANVDAGRDTGIPEVDAVIATFGRRRPKFG